MLGLLFVNVINKAIEHLPYKAVLTILLRYHKWLSFFSVHFFYYICLIIKK